MKLSIIIPVYNVEKYISRCLDSIFQQDIPYSEYEVILVNDGSPDNSAGIIAEYKKRYPNIIYLEKENGGPSSARNKGIDNAKGDYIWFVDADDKIEENCLNELLSYIYNYNLDFCEFDRRFIYDSMEKVIGFNYSLNNQVITALDYISSYSMPFSSCCFIFKRELITQKKIYFIDGIYHEDREFNIRLLAHCNRISFFRNSSNGVYYYYIRERKGSTMTNKDIAHTLKRIDSYIKILYATDKNFPYNKNIKNYAFYVQHLINDIIAYSLVELIQNSAMANKAKFYRKMMKDNDINYRLDVLNGKTKLKFTVLSFVKNNLYLTTLTLKLFDTVGSVLNRVKK